MREPVEALFPRYSRVAYRVLKTVVGSAMRKAYTVEIEGLEHVPPAGPAIIAANHISFLDSFFIPFAVPRRVTYLAKAEYWDSWKTRWFFNTVGQIPLHRQDSTKARGALDSGVRVLRAGGILGIYPEGTRSPDGRLYRGRSGVARMALAAGAPVVPAGLIGTREVMPKDAKLPKTGGHVVIRFAEPRSVPTEATPLALRSFVDGVMYDIRELSGQEYVDRYADRRSRVPAPEEALPEGEIRAIPDGAPVGAER